MPQSTLTSKQNIFLINIGHALVHLLMLLFPVVASLVATSFEENYSTLIMLTTGSWVAFALGSLPAGWLADRWGKNLLMSIFFLGSGISCLLIALSHNYTQLALSLLSLGIFSDLKKIESLEKELINNLDENSFSELIKLKSQINRD